MKFGPLHLCPDGSRWRIVARCADYEAGLVYYPAGISHADHEHSRGQATFVLTGSFEEIAGSNAASISGGTQAYKPSGASHSCRFGRDGALILSVNFARGRDRGLLDSKFALSSLETGRVRRLLLAGCADPADAIDDLLGTLGANPRPVLSKDVPPWIRRIAEQFAEEPLVKVAHVAASHGIHRVQLSRAFQRHLGVSPTHYRLQCKAARAVRLMIEDGEGLAHAAIGAGFADQAHFTRTATELAGVGPSRLRSLLAA